MTKIIVTHVDRCLGCKSCELECAMAHTGGQTWAEAVRSETPPQPRIHIECVGDAMVPVQCHHCGDAACVIVCPTQALHRAADGGPVLLDAEHCIGCRMCLLVCPFGVIELSRSGTKVVKCDQCFDRTEAGLEPACVAGCPTGALQFVDATEHLGQRRHEAATQAASATQVADYVLEMPHGNGEG
jgi:carbon-monoxide dehydrogenase iron sulfur subunit